MFKYSLEENNPIVTRIGPNIVSVSLPPFGKFCRGVLCVSTGPSLTKYGQSIPGSWSRPQIFLFESQVDSESLSIAAPCHIENIMIIKFSCRGTLYELFMNEILAGLVQTLMYESCLK